MTILRFTVWSIISICFFASCFNDQFRESSDTFLEFSRDTLSFDTVFTTLGSATRSFKIFNPYDEPVNVSRIYLKDEANGFFRLNIDGLTGNENRDIEIPRRDSIYVFAEVTIDPDQPISDSPFIIEDEVIIEINGNTQDVLLQAWGQNANYIPNSSNKGGTALLSCDFATVTWNDPKPYVIYGILAIDSCELVLPPGAELYVHGGIAFTGDGNPYNDGIIVVLKDGKIISEGTVDEPVVIQGDRLEMEFEEVPGQWGGIIINDESVGSSFTHTTIKNSIVGVRVDSLARARFQQCQFYNQTANGLLAFHAAEVQADNCLFYNSGSAAVSLQYGGKHELNYCTMASYNSGGTALAASNFRCIEPTCLEGFLFNPIELSITNSIIASDQEDAILFADRSIEEDFTYQLDHCLVRINELLDNPDFATFFNFCDDCLTISEEDTIFLNPFEDDYSLDTVSIARDMAKPLMDIQADLFENMRDPSFPDLGAIEFQE